VQAVARTAVLAHALPAPVLAVVARVAVCWCLLPIGYWMLPVGYWLLPIACFLLAVACYLLDVAYCVGISRTALYRQWGVASL
jgi:hypothetical protein